MSIHESSSDEPSFIQLHLSQIACFLDELDGLSYSISSWRGYHPRISRMAMTRKEYRELADVLAHRLKRVNVAKCSRELQNWWEQYRLNNPQLSLSSAEQLAERAEREIALRKLTERERQLLGLTD